MPDRPNYYATVEAINNRIAIENPDDADLLELAEISRWHSLVQTYHPDGPYTFEPDRPRIKPTQVGEFGFDRIRKTAEFAAETYKGDFTFMIAMRAEMTDKGRLTIAQTAAVLNTLVAQARRRRRYTFSGTPFAKPERATKAAPTTGRFGKKKQETSGE